MCVLRSFEKSAIDFLTADVLAAWQVEEVCSNGKLVRLDFTGHGYLLTLNSSDLPVERLVLDRPSVNGKVGELLTGFVAFVENNEFNLECFAYGKDIIPDNYRNLDVKVFV
ncbi:MAG: hypothetical protein ABJ370_17165 [Paracoccaceae bacterium]